jgi:hypothetical protein
MGNLELGIGRDCAIPALLGGIGNLALGLVIADCLLVTIANN